MDFEAIYQFLCKHYDLIIGIVSLIISVVILVIKKRPILLLDSIKEDILEVLPSIIKECEVPGFGDSKKANAIQVVKLYLQKKYKFNDFDKIESFVSEAIENILDTPQKKG